MTEIIRITPRYYVRHPAGTTGYYERNCRHGEMHWDIALGQIALVCLDIWDMDVHLDMAERDHAIVRDVIVPVVAACREVGLQIIHAPSSPIARRHPNWVGMAGDSETRRTSCRGSPDWPPNAFREYAGEFARFRPPDEDQKLAAWARTRTASFHPDVQPEGGEPVVATGEELHRLCAMRGILFLVYAGFHTPGCMTNRDYGISAMHDRGYRCILLRDCTNGMETHETWDTQLSMRGTIAFMEQNGLCTLLAHQLVSACRSSVR